MALHVRGEELPLGWPKMKPMMAMPSRASRFFGIASYFSSGRRRREGRSSTSATTALYIRLMRQPESVRSPHSRMAWPRCHEGAKMISLLARKDFFRRCNQSRISAGASRLAPLAPIEMKPASPPRRDQQRSIFMPPAKSDHEGGLAM